MMKKNNKAEVIRKLHKENAGRWFGKPVYNCLTCSESMSTEDNQLVCVNKKEHVVVEEDYICEAWN